jgi:D-lactate dehydrogenase (cytochrome)
MSDTATTRLPAGLVDTIRAFLGDRITTNAGLREHHSHGQDTQTPVMPDAVAFVETSEEAAKLLALCHAERIPVVPWGAGTSLEGHVTPVRGGITLDLSRMTKILDVSQPDMDCRGPALAPSAACARPARPAPTRCAMARCERTRWA